MSASVPNIVATVNFLSQTTALATATLYTPAADGWYRVNAYYLVTAGSGSVTPTFNWNDEGGTNRQSQVDQARPIYVQGGQPITAAATITGSPTYNLRFVIEAL